MCEKDIMFLSYLNSHHPCLNEISSYCEKIIEFLEKHFVFTVSREIDSHQGFDTNFICKGINTNLDSKTEQIEESEKKLEAIRRYLTTCIETKEKKSSTITNDYVKIHETEKNIFHLVTTNRRCKLLEDGLPEKEKIVRLFTASTPIMGTSSSSFGEFDFRISKNQFEFVKQSAANSFIQDEQIRQLCKTISQIKISLKDDITQVFHQLVQTFGENYQQMYERIIQFVTIVDVIVAKASLAHKYNYCRPKLQIDSENSFVNAKNLRHCLIEYLQKNENYVTNDICLGSSGILLYGTNAVGKTSLIRALGISVIMAQSGLFVPCTEFVYKPYRSLFTRILGNDNLFKGLSTFAVEMSELRTILRMTNENSLVLGDELCSGTENLSAISIFVAGIQHLERSKSSFIFATHMHEITNYEEICGLSSTVALKHMSVIYDKEKDILIYDRKLKDGPGNNMYGLEVCKSLNLPADFIEAAYHIREKYQPDFKSPLSFKRSHFNAQKIVGLCEKCGEEIGTEVHHLQHQKRANEKGIIENGDDSSFHKNKLANLFTLCESCHQEMHRSKKQHKKVKTSKGYQLREI